MNMPKIPIKTLVPVNAALAALLGLCLSLGIVGKMAAFPVEPGSQALLRLLGLLLFGMSVSLWVPTDLHMRDSRRRGSCGIGSEPSGPESRRPSQRQAAARPPGMATSSQVQEVPQIRVCWMRATQVVKRLPMPSPSASRRRSSWKRLLMGPA